MKKSLIIISLLCASQFALPANAQNSSFYGHDRTWNNMQNAGGSVVSSDYLVPTGSDGNVTRSSAPFGTYRSRTPGVAAPTDPRIIQQQRRMQALQQQQARQQQMWQQQQQMRQRQMYQQAPAGSYYQPGQNTSQAPATYTSGGAATYAPVQTYRPAQTQTRTQGK